MSEVNENLEQNQSEEQKFDIASINEFLGTQFEDVGSLKETWTKNNEFGSKVEELSKTNGDWESKYGDIENKYKSVLSHFSDDNVIEKLYGSEDVWKRAQLGIKFPDKDPNVVSQIYNTNIADLKDADVILLADKLTMGDVGLSDSDRKTAILETLLGKDVDLEDLDPSQRYKLSKAAIEAKGELSSIKDFSPEQPKFDWLEEARQLNTSFAEKQKGLEEGWNNAATQHISNFEGVKVFGKDGDEEVEIFSYEADDKFREQIVPMIKEDFVNRGLDPNKEENVALVNGYIENAFKAQYFDKAVKKAMEQASVKTEDALHNEINNDKEMNKKEAPPRNNQNTSMSIQEYLKSRKK